MGGIAARHPVFSGGGGLPLHALKRATTVLPRGRGRAPRCDGPDTTDERKDAAMSWTEGARAWAWSMAQTDIERIRMSRRITFWLSRAESRGTRTLGARR